MTGHQLSRGVRFFFKFGDAIAIWSVRLADPVYEIGNRMDDRALRREAKR